MAEGSAFAVISVYYFINSMFFNDLSLCGGFGVNGECQFDLTTCILWRTVIAMTPKDLTTCALHDGQRRDLNRVSEPEMQDGSFKVDGERDPKGAGITRLAAEVVAKLVSQDASSKAVLKGPVIDAIIEAARSPDRGALDKLRPEFRRARISPEMLADYYIPEAARRLGRAWEEDSLSFVDVSIGVARLQWFLNEIGSGWGADGTESPNASTLLMIVPEQEQHTLGALAAAGWLRRKGISVCLRIAPTQAELAEILAKRRFDGAMISVACHERLEISAEVVKTLRSEATNSLRVAVGGAVLDNGKDLAAVTGADIVTSDLSKAVEALGLTLRRPLLTVIT